MTTFNIAIAAYALELGGIETFTKTVATFFRQQGHSVTLVEVSNKGAWSERFSEMGFNVVQVLPQFWRSSRHHALRVGRLLSNFDAVFLNDAPAAQASLGLLPSHMVAFPILHMYMTSMVKTVCTDEDNWDTISAVCPSARQSAIEYGVAPSKIVCIPNGVEVSSTWPKEKINFSASRHLRLIYAGRLENKQKRIFDLPSIIKGLADRGVTAILDVVGGGPDLDRLRQMVSECQIDGKVVFHGPLFHEQAIDVLRGADVLLLTSLFEGLPIVLLEGMARGVVPVVSRLKGSTDFVIRSGVDGYLVETGDIPDYIEKLSMLAADRDLLGRMSLSAWERIGSDFSSEKMCRTYLDLLTSNRQLRKNGMAPQRNGKTDTKLLGDFPNLPRCLVRPVRKIGRLIGLVPPFQPEPPLSPPKS